MFATEPEASPEAQAANGNGGGILRTTPGSVIIVAVLAALAVITVLLIAGSGDGDTVTVPLTLATTTTPAPTTSVATTTTVAITTTVAPTTSVATTTTTIPAPIIEPLGSPVEIEELVLAAFAIGDLVLGDPAEVVLGRLAASLGQPDGGQGPSVSGGKFGTCPGDRITVYWWGPLAVVTLATSDGNEIFYGYRLDGRDNDPAAPAAGMKTLSGLGLGDTVVRTTNIYASVFTVETIDDPVEGPVFRILDDGVLLWGPVTSTQDDGIVEGIFAADPCGGALSG